MKNFLISLVLAFAALSASAQITTVTGNATDPDGTVWANGTGTVLYLPVPGFSGALTNKSTGQALAPNPVTFALDGSGNFSVSLPQTKYIVGPSLNAGTSPGVIFTICSAIPTFPCYSTSIIVVGAGPTQSVTAQIAAILQAPRLQGFARFASAYNDTEMLAVGGNTYRRLSDNTQRCNTAGTWGACNAGGGSPGGSVGQLQWNNTTFAGASGGTTNGTHFAFGAGSTVDGGPTVSPGVDPGTWSPKAISNLAETYTGSDLENGLSVNLTLDPSATASPISTYGILSNLQIDGSNVGGGPVFTSIVGNAINDSTGTGDSATSQVVGGAFQAINSSSGEVGLASGTQSLIVNSSTGTIDGAFGNDVSVDNLGTGNIGTLYMLFTNYSTSGGTTGELDGLEIGAPGVSGGTITLARGVDIQEQCGAGITTCYEIDSEGTGLNYFGGPIQSPTTQNVAPGLTSALPTCASAVLLQRAGVTDATVNTPGAALVGSGTWTVPVVCEFHSVGSAYSWVID